MTNGGLQLFSETQCLQLIETRLFYDLRQLQTHSLVHIQAQLGELTFPMYVNVKTVPDPTISPTDTTYSITQYYRITENTVTVVCSIIE